VVWQPRHQQHADFKRVAREVGADTDKDGDAIMERLARQKRRDSRAKPE
jgi:hypothetical protein